MPGSSGNPRGRPTGSRHKASLAALALLNGEAEAITRKAVELAKQGDRQALSLLIPRLIPVRRDLPIELDLPKGRGAEVLVPAAIGALEKAAVGELTPVEAQALSQVVENARRLYETEVLERRIAAAEQLIKELTPDAEERP